MPVWWKTIIDSVEKTVSARDVVRRANGAAISTMIYAELNIHGVPKLIHYCLYETREFVLFGQN